MGIEMQRDLTRAALEGELERLSAEAVDRLQEKAVLPALASLHALKPLVGALITELVDALKDENQTALSDPSLENGLYL